MKNKEFYKKYQNYSLYEIDTEFINACKKGNLEVVKYLLTSTELKDNADIHVDNDYGFRFACYYGKLEVVRYLLTSTDLKEHADIHANNDLGFTNACYNGYLEIIKYLLTSPELKDHADIHANNDEGFRYACVNEKLEIVKYFIFNYKIDKNENIQEYLENDLKEENINLYNKINYWFEMLDLNQYLQDNLNNKKEVKIINKF